MSNSSSLPDTGTLIRRVLFFVLLFSLTLGNLFILFRGLNAPQAMDQAQISREIARGNGFTTKFIRPVAYYQATQASKSAVSLKGFQDTYQSPLNPLINALIFKLVGADDAGAFQMRENEMVFPLDRVIVTVSTLFFIIAIGVNYLLISRIFDAKIAGVCALLMLFSQTFWTYSLSGLPQMLMLMLFSCGIYFVYRAVEENTEGRLAMIPAIIAGIFFTLLALTHWLTVWIALGYIIFASISFRPRGVVGITVLGMLLLTGIAVMLRNNSISANPFGTAMLTLYNGLASSSENVVMRTHDLSANPLNLDGMILKVVRTTMMQITEIIPLLAGIVIAPVFFLSLLHPFRKLSIASFRWAILLMWVCAAFGLAFFGISKDELDPNQIHLLFAPIMAAYGLAFISILWSRLEVVTSVPLLRNVHHIIIVLVCATPLLLALPNQITVGLNFHIPQWPPYAPSALNNAETGLKRYVKNDQVIFSDQPWSTAWYADRTSIWLPLTREGFQKLETTAADQQTPVAGILISPASHGSAPMREVAGRYQDFTSLVFDGRVALATYPPGFTIFDKDPKMQAIYKRYGFRIPLVSLDMVFYRDTASSPANPSDN